jgi:hypothetical protein
MSQCYVAASVFMLQVVSAYLEVAYVFCGYRSCICCNGYTCMLQVYILNVLVVFKSMVQVFYLNVAYVTVAMHICCKRMFSNIASVPDIYCNKCFML